MGGIFFSELSSYEKFQKNCHSHQKMKIESEFSCASRIHEGEKSGVHSGLGRRGVAVVPEGHGGPNGGQREEAREGGVEIVQCDGPPDPRPEPEGGRMVPSQIEINCR